MLQRHPESSRFLRSDPDNLSEQLKRLGYVDGLRKIAIGSRRPSSESATWARLLLNCSDLPEHWVSPKAFDCFGSDRGTATHASNAPSPSAEKLERIATFFDHEVAHRKIAVAVNLIQQHGRPIYLRCFGVRDVATKRLMPPDTIFPLQSITKPIASVAAMMLIDAESLRCSIACPNSFHHSPN